MSKWRLILTNSESESGIAPVCADPVHPKPTDPWVLDCCPGPHIECCTNSYARRVVALLNAVEAEVCS